VLIGALALLIGLGTLGAVASLIVAEPTLDSAALLVVGAIVLMGPAVPLVYGLARFQRALRAPRRVGADGTEIHLAFLGKTVSVRVDAVDSLTTANSLLSGAVLVVGVRGASPVRAVGLDARVIESAVAEIEAHAPEPPADPWAISAAPDGTLHRDARHSKAVGEPLTPPRGVWVTPTLPYAVSQRIPASRFAAFIAAVAGQQAATAALPFVATWEGVLVVVAAIFLPVFLPGFVLYLRFRRPPGESVLILPEGGIRFDQTATAVDLAWSRAGIASPAPARRRRLGAVRYSWRTPDGMRVNLSVALTATQTTLRVLTPAAEMAEAHQRLKGAITEALTFGPERLGRYEPASARPRPGAGAREAQPWNHSVLADGTLVADSAWVSNLYKGIEEAPGWMSRSRETDRRVYAMAFPFLGGLLIAVPIIIGQSLGVPLGAMLAWAAVAEASVLLPLAWYALPIARGEGAVAIMSVAKSVAAEEATARVRLAIESLGEPVSLDRRGAVWHVWRLQAGVRVRLITSQTDDPHRILISARRAAARGPYVRLKGRMLEAFGSPVSPRQP